MYFRQVNLVLNCYYFLICMDFCVLFPRRDIEDKYLAILSFVGIVKLFFVLKARKVKIIYKKKKYKKKTKDYKPNNLTVVNTNTKFRSTEV